MSRLARKSSAAEPAPEMHARVISTSGAPRQGWPSEDEGKGRDIAWMIEAGRKIWVGGFGEGEGGTRINYRRARWRQL